MDRPRHVRRLPLALLSALSISACSSAASSGGTGSVPPPSAADLLAFTHATNILVVPVDVAGTTGLLGIDTGDPFLLLNPATFPGAPAVGNVASVTVGAETLTNVAVITSKESPPSPDPAIVFGGLLGCTVLCSSLVGFNYRDAAFTIGAASPAGLGPETKVTFMLQGGGTAQSGGGAVTIPRSRVVVSVLIEGAKHTMMLDTGASYVVVNAALFAALTRDGRPVIDGGSATTVSGMSSVSLTRAKTMALGGATVDHVVVGHDASFDTNLATVSAETGQTIEGSLGGTFLTNFFVAIDYPNQEVRLAPYTDTSFIIDPGASLDITLGVGGTGGPVVVRVGTGSDAESKGVSVGDAIVAVDGQPLEGLSLSRLRALLGGQPGTARSISFGSASRLANQTISLTLGDRIPVP